jgi:hypothetical protein
VFSLPQPIHVSIEQINGIRVRPTTMQPVPDFGELVAVKGQLDVGAGFLKLA